MILTRPERADAVTLDSNSYAERNTRPKQDEAPLAGLWTAGGVGLPYTPEFITKLYKL